MGQQGDPEAKRGRARDALAEAYKILDLALWESGDLARANNGERALGIYDELGDLRNQAIVLNNMGLIAHDRSRWEESTDLYRRGLDIADRIGDRSLGALMKFNVTEVLIDRGLLDEAEPLIREVIRLWRAAGAQTDVAEANRELGRLLARRGDFEEANNLFDATRAYQLHEGTTAEVLRTDVRRIELRLLEGRADEALELVDRGRSDGGHDRRRDRRGDEPDSPARLRPAAAGSGRGGACGARPGSATVARAQRAVGGGADARRVRPPRGALRGHGRSGRCSRRARRHSGAGIIAAPAFATGFRAD